MGVRVPPPAPVSNLEVKMRKQKLNLPCFILAVMGFFLLNFFLPCYAQQEPVNQMEVASKAFEEGKYEEAIQIYSSILKTSPDNIAARARLARSFYLAANKNPAYLYQAANEYNKLTQQVPNFSLSYLELGQIAYLLGLASEAEGRERHARGLYESALDWFAKYIHLERQGDTLENQIQIPITKVLQAVVCSRMGEIDKAFQLVAEAKKEYKALFSQSEDLPSLYDYFAKSGVEYANATLHNQALIYLEGAWLIESRPQIGTLLENVIKAKGISISLLPPFPKKEEEMTHQQIMEKEIERLSLQLDLLEKKLEIIPSLKEEMEGLKKKVGELLELEFEIKKIIAEVDRLPETLNQKQNEQEVEKYSDEIFRLNERISSLSDGVAEINQRMEDLEKRMQELTQNVKEIKTVADMFGILNIQLRELRKTVEELEKQMLQRKEQ